MGLPGRARGLPGGSRQRHNRPQNGHRCLEKLPFDCFDCDAHPSPRNAPFELRGQARSLESLTATMIRISGLRRYGRGTGHYGLLEAGLSHRKEIRVGTGSTTMGPAENPTNDSDNR